MVINTNFIHTDDIIKYVDVLTGRFPVITEYSASGEDELYLEYQYFVVPGHFHFVIMDDDWEDKMYRFSFIRNEYNILQHSEDCSYHKEIERLCQWAKNIAYARNIKNIVLPGAYQPVPWTPDDKVAIEQRIENIIQPRNPKRVRQR